jgi:cytochrome P450
MKNRNKKRPPGPSTLGALRIAPKLMRDTLQTLIGMVDDYGDFARMRLGGTTIYLLTNPDYVKYVLQDNHSNYKKSSIYHEFSVLLGDNSLLTTNNTEKWRSQGRLIQPAFSRTHLESYSTSMIALTARMLDEWDERARAATDSDNGAAVIDVYEELVRLLLSITGTLLFGVDIGRDAPQVARSMLTAFTFAMSRVNAPIKLPRDFPTPARRRTARAVDALDAIVRDLIAQRRRDENKYDDLLAVLIRASDEETGAKMTDDELLDQIKTMLVAGHESPANCLTWALHLLAQNPEAAAKLNEEIRVVLGGRAPAFADLPKLEYTRMVLDESMRLYPPAWLVEREPIQNDEIAGYPVKAGSRVTMFMYGVHRLPGVWDDPEKFEPERFSEERSKDRHKFAFFPFSGGPRLCRGKDLSYVEMVLVLAMIVQRFELQPKPDHPVEALASVNLRPKHGMQMLVRTKSAGVRAAAPG